MAAHLPESLLRLKDYIEEERFRGYDPYDALNSPLLRGVSFNNKLLRILFIQALKKFPFNLRPILGIQKDFNPKGIGLFLWGYAKLQVSEPSYENTETLKRLINILKETRSPAYSGYCWGYNFDWQSRAFYLPKYTPTIVNTSFIGHALLDCFLHTKNVQALEMAVSAKDFIINDLHRKTEGSWLCFSYSPMDEIYVHNANLLGASLLIRLYGSTGDEFLRDTALSSLGYSMRHQRSDGSWPYAETAYQGWIDSFHTGFNLQSIHYFIECGFGDDCRNVFENGLRFYEERFFLEDGTPKYYHDRLYPIDIHSAAQAVVLFSRLGGRYLDLATKIADWMIGSFQDRTGYLYFQKNRFFTNKIPYMRWAQAWAFHAFTEHLLQQRGHLS
jgi:hypothetical protein